MKEVHAHPIARDESDWRKESYSLAEVARSTVDESTCDELRVIHE